MQICIVEHNLPLIFYNSNFSGKSFQLQLFSFQFNKNSPGIFVNSSCGLADRPKSAARFQHMGIGVCTSLCIYTSIHAHIYAHIHEAGSKDLEKAGFHEDTIDGIQQIWTSCAATLNSLDPNEKKTNPQNQTKPTFKHVCH